VTPLKFARALAEFQGELEWLAGEHRCYDNPCPAAALAASFLALLRSLTVIADGEAVAASVATAIRAFNATEYAEAARRHQIAVTAQCPYCGAGPGAECRTTSGPGGGGHPKGVHDHARRYDAALDLPGLPGAGS